MHKELHFSPNTHSLRTFLTMNVQFSETITLPLRSHIGQGLSIFSICFPIYCCKLGQWGYILHGLQLHSIFLPTHFFVHSSHSWQMGTMTEITTRACSTCNDIFSSFIYLSLCKNTSQVHHLFYQMRDISCPSIFSISLLSSNLADVDKLKSSSIVDVEKQNRYGVVSNKTLQYRENYFQETLSRLPTYRLIFRQLHYFSLDLFSIATLCFVAKSLLLVDNNEAVYHYSLAKEGQREKSIIQIGG